jgi:NitT/TauT family transport system substrate-binding protein
MDKQTLIIGSGKWTGYEPLYLAEQVGIFDKNEASIKLIRHLNEYEILSKLKSGDIHGAALTLDMLFVLYESGFPCKAVLVLDYSIGGDMIIGKSGVNNLNDLKGGKIGLEKLYVNEYFLARSLAEKNIKSKEIEIVYIPEGKHIEYLENSEVDAVVAYNPLATFLLQKGYELIFSSKDIPSSIIDVLVFPNHIFENNYTNILKIIQAWFDSIRYIDLHYMDSMMIMSESEGVSEYEFKMAFEDILIPDLKQNLAFFDLESEKNIFKISDITMDFMFKRKMIKSKIDTSQIFDSSILKSVK